jgi:uncharacterized protein YdaU (DUF1376 family)
MTRESEFKKVRFGIKMKIKYVQLESDAFLTDVDFVQFTPAERGVYCSLILSLTSNDGKCTSEPEALSRICNCRSVEEFEKIWLRISKKFRLRKGFIRHKRVSKELSRAKKLLQAKRRGGLSTARKRQHSTGTACGTAGAMERKRNEKVSEDLTNTNTADQSAITSDSLRNPQLNALRFIEALSRLIPPRSRSDRTCFRRVADWLAEGCCGGRFNAEIFDRVLDYARQARQGDNPAAVFMATLKDELGYVKKGKS